MNSGKTLQPLPDDGEDQVHLPRDRNRRQRVIDIEEAGDVQLYCSQQNIPTVEGETGGGPE